MISLFLSVFFIAGSVGTLRLVGYVTRDQGKDSPSSPPNRLKNYIPYFYFLMRQIILKQEAEAKTASIQNIPYKEFL